MACSTSLALQQRAWLGRDHVSASKPRLPPRALPPRRAGHISSPPPVWACVGTLATARLPWPHRGAGPRAQN